MKGMNKARRRRTGGIDIAGLGLTDRDRERDEFLDKLFARAQANPNATMNICADIVEIIPALRDPSWSGHLAPFVMSARLAVEGHPDCKGMGCFGCTKAWSRHRAPVVAARLWFPEVDAKMAMIVALCGECSDDDWDEAVKKGIARDLPVSISSVMKAGHA